MAQTSFRIRAARLVDAAEVARLAAVLGYPPEVGETASRLAVLLPRPSHYLAVAQNDESLLGWIAAEKRLLLISGEKVELTGLVVDPAAQREGVGRALVAAAEVWARDSGVQEVIVRSNVVRSQSHPFYESLGYGRVKTQHVYAKKLTG